MEPTMEKTQKELQNPLQVKNQRTICLICDQKFENVQQCNLHIKTVHFLKKLKTEFPLSTKQSFHLFRSML